MKTRFHTLMLTTSLVGSVAFAGMQSAQAQMMQSPYPYCKALQLPMPEKKGPPGQVQPAAPPANGPAQPATAPGAAPPATPSAAPQVTPGAAPPATVDPKADPKATGAAPAVPNLVDLLKDSTDAKAAAAKILDAAAPSKPEEFDQMYADWYHRIITMYIEPSDLMKVNLPAMEHKYDGKMQSWSDFTAALGDLFKAVGNRYTYVHSGAEILAHQIGQGENLVEFGASLHLRDDGSFEVEFLEPGTTAQLGGFREGDQIESVNGQSLKGKTKDEVEKLLRASEGNTLKITSVQDGQRVEGEFTLHAAADDANAPKAELVHNNLAYIKLPSFMNEKAFKQLLSALIGMEVSTPGGLQGMILDLRYNGGGSVEMAKSLIQTLESTAVVIHEKKRQGREVVDETTSLIPAPEIMLVSANKVQQAAVDELRKLPLVVMVNGSSASAAEITTGALREGRANTIVLGKRSFGKFMEMSVMPTPDCGEAAILSAMYTTPDGHWYQGLGITPDIVVDNVRGAKDDLQMDKAVEWLVDKTRANSANVANLDPNEMKILGKVVDKPLEPKVTTVQEWVNANWGYIRIGGAAIVLLLIGAALWFVSRPAKKKEED